MTELIVDVFVRETLDRCRAFVLSEVNRRAGSQKQRHFPGNPAVPIERRIDHENQILLMVVADGRSTGATG
jgi:hypothetical protein